VTKEKVITMNDEQFHKIKLTRTLYSAKIIGSSEPEYFLDYKITTVRYLPTDEHYDIVREMFKICDNDPDNVVNWYNKKILKNVKNRLEAWDKDHISINMMKYERLIKCKNETRDFLMDRGIIIEHELSKKIKEKQKQGRNSIIKVITNKYPKAIWGDVFFKFPAKSEAINGESKIGIKHKGESYTYYTFRELGLLKKNLGPKREWVVFNAFVLSDIPPIKANKTKQKGHISKFRNLLKDLTGIENDPFLPYGNDGAWKPAFRYSRTEENIHLEYIEDKGYTN
jgi:hypothetical protein